jgi:hypothetical protein
MTKEQELEQKNQAKIDRYANYQGQRVASHKKNMPAPIIKDKEGNIRWLNRAQRRKAKIK